MSSDRRNRIAQWAFDTRPILGRFHLWLEDVDERWIKAIDAAYQHGFLGQDILGSGFDLDMSVHRGAGAYICGEESALLESLEGKKGLPRLRPPYPAIAGLFGCPTVINNVETLSCVPKIIEKGGAWFAKLGHGRTGGTRLFSMSGHVEKPGLYEASHGITLRELIEAAGGVRGGRSLKAVVPGGVAKARLKVSHKPGGERVTFYKVVVFDEEGERNVLRFDARTCEGIEPTAPEISMLDAIGVALVEVGGGFPVAAKLRFPGLEPVYKVVILLPRTRMVVFVDGVSGEVLGSREWRRKHDGADEMADDESEDDSLE